MYLEVIEYTKKDIESIMEMFNTNESFVLVEIKELDNGKSLGLFFDRSHKNINEDEKMKTLGFECCGGGLQEDGKCVDIYQKVIEVEGEHPDTTYYYVSPENLYL